MRYAFISPQWFAALHAVISEKARAAAEPNLSFAMCELFTDVPARYATMSGNKAAWHAVIRGADIRFELEEADEVDFKAVADYRAVLPLARYDTMNREDRATELQAMAQALVATGKLRIIGTPPSAGGPFQSVHDAMCLLTA